MSFGKIGTSFGRCLRDIVNGEIEFDDVMVIVSNTCIETEDQAIEVINAYMNRYDYLLDLDREKCITLGLKLFKSGKLHQPRINTRTYVGHNYPQLWYDIIPSELSSSDVVKEAWNSYKMAQRLVDG